MRPQRVHCPSILARVLPLVPETSPSPNLSVCPHARLVFVTGVGHIYPKQDPRIQVVDWPSANWRQETERIGVRLAISSFFESFVLCKGHKNFHHGSKSFQFVRQKMMMLDLEQRAK